MRVRHTVHLLLEVTAATSEKVMGSSTLEPRLEIYLAVCKEELAGHAEIIAVAMDGISDIRRLVSYRNDLAHARWGVVPDFTKGTRKLFPGAPKIDLQAIDGKTEALSVATNKLAFVLWEAWKVCYPNRALPGAQPWRDRFELLPHLDPNRTAPRHSLRASARGHRPPPLRE